MKKILCLAAFAIAFANCKKEDTSPADSAPTTTAVQLHVQYSISCTDCDVIYKRANGVDTILHHQTSAFNYEFEASAGQVVTLIAINTANNPQSVSATISLNGSTLQHGQSYCPITGLVMLTDTLQ